MTRARWRTRLVLLVVLPVAVVAASAVMSGSVGSFSAQVVNNANTFSSSVLVLGDSQGGIGGACSGSCQTGTALINVSNVEPGTIVTDCLEVGWFTNRGVASVTMTPTISTGPALAADLVVPTSQFNSTAGSSFTLPHALGSANPGCASYPAGGTNTSVPASGGGAPSSTTPLSTWASGTAYGASTTNWTWYRFSIQLPAADSSCATYCGLSTQVAITFTATST
jgi:hypothetical protein